MNHSVERGVSSTGSGFSARSVLVIAVLALGGAALHGQTPTDPTPAGNRSSTMKRFVFLFRQGPTPLSEADQKRRAEEVRAWAMRLNNDGRRLDPRKLGEEQRWIGPDSEVAPAAPADCGSLANILFLEARDFAEAVSIAQTHPGLRYGASPVNPEFEGSPPTRPGRTSTARRESWVCTIASTDVLYAPSVAAALRAPRSG